VKGREGGNKREREREERERERRGREMRKSKRDGINTLEQNIIF
jgi:hypothetical protein